MFKDHIGYEQYAIITELTKQKQNLLTGPGNLVLASGMAVPRRLILSHSFCAALS